MISSETSHFVNRLVTTLDHTRLPLEEPGDDSRNKNHSRITPSEAFPRGDDRHLKEVLIEVIRVTAEIYKKYNSSCWSFSHSHGWRGRRRVDAFAREVQNNSSTYKELKNIVLRYLANPANGNEHPHSFRPLLRDQLEKSFPGFFIDYVNDDLKDHLYTLIFGRELEDSEEVNYEGDRINIMAARTQAVASCNLNPRKFNMRFPRIARARGSLVHVGEPKSLTSYLPAFPTFPKPTFESFYPFPMRETIPEQDLFAEVESRINDARKSLYRADHISAHIFHLSVNSRNFADISSEYFLVLSYRIFTYEELKTYFENRFGPELHPRNCSHCEDMVEDHKTRFEEKEKKADERYQKKCSEYYERERLERERTRRQAEWNAKKEEERRQQEIQDTYKRAREILGRQLEVDLENDHHRDMVRQVLFRASPLDDIKLYEAKKELGSIESVCS